MQLLTMPYLLFITVLLSVSGVSAQEAGKEKHHTDEKLIVRIMKSSNALRQNLLKLALEKSGRPYEIVMGPSRLSPQRRRMLLKTNSDLLSLSWDDALPELEKNLLPVMIPAYRGLSSYRLLIIHKDNQVAFDTVKSFRDLARAKALLGAGWLSADVLESVGLPVVTAEFFNIRKMIASRRGDYYPADILTIMLGLSQKWAKNAAIVTEKGLLVYLPTITYIYVARNNTALHAAIYEGMAAAIADGSWDEVIKKHIRKSGILSDISSINLRERRFVKINNSFLSDETRAVFDKYKLDVFDFWESVQNGE